MWQLFRFVIVGVFNTAVGFGIIFACMYVLGLGAYLSNAIGYGCGLVVSYFLNKSFTFKSTVKGTSEAARFLLAFGIAYLCNFGVLYLCVRIAGLHEGVAQVIASVAYVSVSFFLNKYYVFRTRGELVPWSGSN
ncbi:MAG TPA: GtrA family protein [Stenotrophomonas sp.]|nr:GtrA family protein [Stenotrophomonas sp.]